MTFSRRRRLNNVSNEEAAGAIGATGGASEPLFAMHVLTLVGLQRGANDAIQAFELLFTVKLGSQRTAGRMQGIQHVKVGGKAKLICPAAAAYGERGIPGVIPPNATLTFEVKVLSMQQ